jgi:hypothetical protein
MTSVDDSDDAIWERLRRKHWAHVRDANTPNERIEFCCGVGWATLLDALFTRAAAALNGSSEKLRVHQIKQKLGGLRIYIDDLPAPFDAALCAMITEAEFLSFAICEVCGRPGRLMVDRFGWWTTRCEDHAPPEAKANRHPPRQLFEAPDGRRMLWTIDADGRLVEREITDDAEWRKVRGES